MPPVEKKNLHVPLPTDVYRRLRRLAERSRRPATELAREAIHRWIEEAERQALHAEIACYAAAAGGSTDDLDPTLEAAGLESLAAEGSRRRPTAARRRK